jgi:hypothetical protein
MEPSRWPAVPSSSDGDPHTVALWICGPTAVGKSAVGWVVYERALMAGIPAAYVDLAQIGQLAPSRSDSRQPQTQGAQSGFRLANSPRGRRSASCIHRSDGSA